MTDHEFHAVKIGPFVSGSVRERRPRTRSERRTRLLVWFVTIFVIGTANVPIALVMLTVTLLAMLFTAPTQTPNERNHR